MDDRLVAWARAVKSRRRWIVGGPPPLWLFTEPSRMPDVVAAVRALPRGLCGVVLRHDGVAGRPGLARRVGRVCRERRLAMTVAGGPGSKIAGVGVHARGGWGPRASGTASAHGMAELVRGARGRAVFLSPVFPTLSHPGVRTLGVVRWAGMAHRVSGPVLALGGVDGRSARRLPRWVAGVGAIGALLG